MNIDYPTQTQMDDLRTLWRQAFGDDEAFLEQFYTCGFAPDRCRCVTVDGRLVAALYWFDCTLEDRPLAYLYGVATAGDFRGRGICRVLMEDTHAHLKYLGYDGAILVPAEETFFRMYEKMGYTVCSSVSEFTCAAAQEPVAMQQVDAAQYCIARRKYLPERGVVQEGDSLNFLQTMADFYAGEDFLVAVSGDGAFFAPELLGNTQAAPGILTALHKSEGRFRTPGTARPFAMYHPLSDYPAPNYFGLAFD